MLGFFPDLKINKDWTQLKTLVESVAQNFVHTDRFKQHLFLTKGASLVASIPDLGGWISKSQYSHDFFVMGGVPDTLELDQKFKQEFPELTFTPATICWSSEDIPEHKDHITNGQSSLVYPLHDHAHSVGTVFDPDCKQDFEYATKQDCPVVINITIPHMVKIQGPRIWFSIHMHESVADVKNVFDNRGPIIV